MKKTFVLLLPLLLAAKFASADVTTADDMITQQTGAHAASQITFEPGRATLTSEEINALNDMVAQNRQDNGKIDSVKVFVWGDKVYSETAGNAYTSQEKKVADERVKNIKNYLKKELKVKDIETFNMTRQPQAFSDLWHAAGSSVKGSASTATAPNTTASAPTAANSAKAGQDFAKGSPSEALVLVYRK